MKKQVNKLFSNCLGLLKNESRHRLCLIDFQTNQINWFRVLRDIEILRHEATLLQDQMRAVRGDVEKVNQDTAEGMKNLIELDRVKNRIQSASKALQEADNWVTLSTQIDEIFDSKDTTQVKHVWIECHSSDDFVFEDRCKTHRYATVIENFD